MILSRWIYCPWNHSLQSDVAKPRSFLSSPLCCCAPYFFVDPANATKLLSRSNFFIILTHFPFFLRCQTNVYFPFSFPFPIFLEFYFFPLQSTQMAVSVSASTIPSLSSDRTTFLAASAASSSHSSILSSASSLQFPAQLRRFRIGTKGISAPSRPRILPVVTNFLFRCFLVCMFAEKVLELNRMWIIFFTFVRCRFQFI